MPPETAPAASGETPAAPDAQAPAQPAAAAPAAPAAATAGPPAAPDGSQAEPFDPERAMRTIAQLREIERKAKADARELAALKAAQQAREDAELSEKDRATKRTAELEAELKRTTDDYRSRLIRLAAEGAARDLKFRDPKLAVRLLDLTAVELDDDGEPTNLPALLKAELKANPYLAEAEPADPGPGPAPIGATPRPVNGQALSVAERERADQEMRLRVRRAWG